MLMATDPHTRAVVTGGKSTNASVRFVQRLSPGVSSGSDLAELRRRLTALVKSTLGEVAVWYGVPAVPPTAERSVWLYMLELGPASTQAKQARVLQFNVRFVVTAWAPDPETASDDLAELVFAALDETDVDIGLEPLPAATWAALGVAPRPSFTLSALVRRVREARPTSLVREPVLQLTFAAVPLQGCLLEQDETPIAGAQIELPALRVSTVTDSQGCFGFVSIPSGRSIRLVAKARGISAVFDVKVAQGQPPFVSLRVALNPQS
jgi:hypothetical protein